MTDARLLLYNALLIAFAPVLLLKKAAKFRSRGHAHEWDLERWNAPAKLDSFVDERAANDSSNATRFVDERAANVPPSAHAFVDEKKRESLRRRNDSNSNAAKPIRVVLVALSWGEVGILNEISARLESVRPDVEIVWSIRERDAQVQAKRAFPSRTVVSMPFDFAAPVARWMETVAPDVLVVVEKFWWPNLVWSAKNRGARVVLVNGRSRGRERARYRLMTRFQKWVLGAFDALCFESDTQIERVREVLPRGAQIVATGNVKFGFERAAPPPQVRELEAWLDARARDENGPLPLLVAGSTAPEDEELVLQAWETVRAEIACALLIAPRRVARADSFVDERKSRNQPVSRRSMSDENGAEILVLDTLGELSFVYGFARAAYVGGALTGRGHNIIEPIAHGVGVAYGPNRGDFESAQRAAEEFEVGARLQSAEELAAFWRRALVDESWRAQTAARCDALMRANRGALERVVEVLGREVDKSRSENSVKVRGVIPLPPGEGA